MHSCRPPHRGLDEYLLIALLYLTHFIHCSMLFATVWWLLNLQWQQDLLQLDGHDLAYVWITALRWVGFPIDQKKLDPEIIQSCKSYVDAREQHVLELLRKAARAGRFWSEGAPP